jgi:replication factor C large subunit
MMLWTDKHRPKDAEGIAGQGEAVSQARKFLREWKRGRGLILYGPPGTGKTLLASLLAAERGDFLLHVDASDTLSGKNVEEMLGQASIQKTLFYHGKIILIDEVDSLSGTADRGAAGSILKIIEQSRFPVIICANDVADSRLKDIRKVCSKVRMDKVDKKDIASYLSAIASKEGISAGEGVLSSIARWADGDVRSAILDFQMIALGRKEVTDDDFLSLGFRERRKALDDVLSCIIRSQSMKANRLTLRNSDADPDDVFIWLESNILLTSHSAEFLAEAYGNLAVADVFRARVMRQQNWRFKAYMSDVMAGIAPLSPEKLSVPEQYRFPDRIGLLAAGRFRKAAIAPLLERVSEELHCSRRDANVDYIPLLALLAAQGKDAAEQLGLSEEDREALQKY